MKLKINRFLLLIGLVLLVSSCKKEYITNEYITNENIYTSEYYQSVILQQKEITEDIRPEYLKEGDTVAIFAASNYVTASELSNGISKLKSWGLNVVLADNLYKQDGRYAGTLDERITGFQKVIDNKNIKALISARGGYGAAQVISFINFDDLKDNPKWIVGYSDVTAIHAAINNLGIESIHGAMAYNLSNESSAESLRKALFGELTQHSISTNDNCTTGSAEGRLVGGNLSLIYSLGGTLFDLNVKNAILFIEDTGESNYSIDRMLTNLKLSGKLDCIKGVIVGEFINTTQGIDEPLNEIIKSKLKDLNIPVLYGINIGHDTENLATYLGRTIQLDVNNETATITY